MSKFKINKQKFRNEIIYVSHDILVDLQKAKDYLFKKFGVDFKLAKELETIHDSYRAQVFQPLNRVRILVEEFENSTFDFKEALKKVEFNVDNDMFKLEDKVVDVTTSGFYEDSPENPSTISVLKFKIDKQFVTLAEATNAFYTLSPTLSYLLLADNKISNPKDFDTYAKNFIESSDSTFKTWLVKGYFSVAHIEDIQTKYYDVTGKMFNWKSIESEFDTLVANVDKDVVLTNSKITPTKVEMAVGVAAAFGGFKGLEELTKPATPSYSPATSVSSTSKLESEIEELKAELEKYKEKEFSEIREHMAAIEEEPLPEEVKMEEITSKDIDAEARDKFYAENDVSQSRYESLEEFRAMDYDKQVEALQNVGYTEIDAKKLATDIAMGGTAFVLGKESLQIANISNQLASTAGIANHNTQFGTQLNYEYVSSGNANYDLGIMTNNDLMQSRFNVNAAKQDYSLAVNDANIANANLTSAKQDYDNVLNSIKAESGDDPSNWTSEQIASYNQAADNYDKALNESKTANENVDKCKKKYNKAKEDYNQVYEDIRENVIRDVDASKNNNINTNPVGNTEILDENIDSNTLAGNIESQINDSIKFGEDNLVIEDGNSDLGNNTMTYINNSFMSNDNNQNEDSKQPITIKDDTIVINDDVFNLNDLL